jgi:hypothetical protein
MENKNKDDDLFDRLSVREKKKFFVCDQIIAFIDNRFESIFK